MMRGGPRKKKEKVPIYPVKHIDPSTVDYTPPLSREEIMHPAPSPDRSHWDKINPGKRR